MKKFKLVLGIAVSLVTLLTLLAPTVDAAPVTAAPCDTKNSSFLGLPTWYEFLPGKVNDEGGCDPQLATIDTTAPTCNTTNCDRQSGVDISKLWLIGLAVLDILLTLGGVLAVIMVVFGSFKYITSQGNPDATKGARETIINAFVGMVIAIIASISVNFGADLLQPSPTSTPTTCPTGQSGVPPNCTATRTIRNTP